MSHISKVAFAATVVAIAISSVPSAASARHGSKFPLTRCGPELAYLCPIHGYFDLTPFHYNLAIHPGCINVVAVDTPNGVERRETVVCGAPQRPMVWW